MFIFSLWICYVTTTVNIESKATSAYLLTTQARVHTLIIPDVAVAVCICMCTLIKQTRECDVL